MINKAKQTILTGTVMEGVFGTTNVHPPAADDLAVTAARRASAEDGKSQDEGGKSKDEGPRDRAQFDAIIEALLGAPGMRYEPGTVGGVKGWWCRPDGARPGARLIYAHGGGYVLGSAYPFRKLAGQLALCARADAFIPDNPLAPEHPFPAAIDYVWAVYRCLAREGAGAIALAGESAGVGLALAVLSLAAQDGEGVLHPCCAAACRHGLFNALGSVQAEHDGKVVFRFGEEHFTLKRPHDDHIGTAEVALVRRFLLETGCMPASALADLGSRDAPDLLVVIDHHEARVFRLDVRSRDAAEHRIEPHDPHHFLHHLSHKDQPREREQRAHEDAGSYEQISEALIAGGRIVVVGHGAGHSDAASHLVASLRTYHPEVFQRLWRVVTADISAMTRPELLDAGRLALLEATSVLVEND